MAEQTLKERIEIKSRNLWDSTKRVLWKGTGVAVGGWILCGLLSHNGCVDSARTKNAMRNHRKNNPVKVVKDVKETWRDNSTMALIYSVFGGGGYNPQVIRMITFEDGSKTHLNYRTMAHQPFMRWLHGEEFNPQPGEIYEINEYTNVLGQRINSLVQKIE